MRANLTAKFWFGATSNTSTDNLYSWTSYYIILNHYLAGTYRSFSCEVVKQPVVHAEGIIFYVQTIYLLSEGQSEPFDCSIQLFQVDNFGVVC